MSQNRPPEKAVEAFWHWFLLHHEEIEAMLDRNDTRGVVRELSPHVDALCAGLAWEIGPGFVQTYMLVLTAEGAASKKAVVQGIMQDAPRVPGWEFHSSRPAKPFQHEIRLPDKDLVIKTSKWGFALAPSASSDRFDLQVFDAELARLGREAGLTAVFLLLDSVLGEDMVERWIGDIRILSAPTSAAERMPMPSIAERLAELIAKKENC